PPLLSPLSFFFSGPRPPRDLHSFPTRRSSDLQAPRLLGRHVRDRAEDDSGLRRMDGERRRIRDVRRRVDVERLGQPEIQHLHLRSEEHTSELQSRGHLVCRLLLEKKKKIQQYI